MKLTFIKKSITSIISCALLLVFVPHVSTFAALEDIKKLGGRYDDLQVAKYQYLENNPDDDTEYECHHLVAKEALNQWGNYIRTKYGVNRRNAFLTDDFRQTWAPSIIMEKSDHEKVHSYWDIYSTPEQCYQAQAYVDKQAKKIIYYGNVTGVLRREINFIKKTFKHKYDRAIDEVRKYIHYLQLMCPDTRLIMRHPYHYREYFFYHFGI